MSRPIRGFDPVPGMVKAEEELLGGIVRGERGEAFIDGKKIGDVTSMIVTPSTADRMAEALDSKIVGEVRDAAIVAGIPIRAVEWCPEDVILAFTEPPAAKVRPEPPAHVGYNSNHNRRTLEFGSYDEYERTFPREVLRLSMTLTFSTAPVLVRPSWLHPFRRTLWVHHHGPQCPEVIPPGAAHRVIKRPSWSRT